MTTFRTPLQNNGAPPVFSTRPAAAPARTSGGLIAPDPKKLLRKVDIPKSTALSLRTNNNAALSVVVSEKQSPKNIPENHVSPRFHIESALRPLHGVEKEVCNADNELVGPTRSRLKLVVFDFDCTLSAFHMFASLSGSTCNRLTLRATAPHACSERGQLRRIFEMEGDPYWGPGMFAKMVFGGTKRIEKVRNFLSALVHRHDVECIICSRGLVGPIQKCLEQLDLARFFIGTFGNLGDALGASEFDVKISSDAFDREEEKILGTKGMKLGSSKAEKIAKCMEDRRLSFHEALFVDDDIDEIKEVQHLCRTLSVIGGCGVCDGEIKCIEGMVDVGNKK